MAEKIIIRPIKPKNPRYFSGFPEVLERELTSTMKGPVAKTLIKAEEARTKNWEHAPEIRAIFTPQKTQLKLLVTPFGTYKRLWVFVSGGAAGKTYSAKRGPYMTVRGGYKPKTTVNNKYGGKGTYSGDVYRAQTVHWPGIKPREFEKNIVREEKRGIEKVMQKAIERALKGW